MSSKGTKVLKTSFWMLIITWYTRILSICSLIVLTRNLDKQDFGIVAGCFVVRAFFISLSNVGSESYLMKKIDITDDDLNSAWTINVITKTIIACLIFSLSESAAEFMKIPELSLAMKVMCFSALFMGFKNSALTLKVKKLDYSQILMLDVISKTVSSLVSITIAIIYQTYWAIVLSEVIHQLFYNVGSHFVTNYRVKFSIKRLSDQWGFSQWVLLRGIINYIRYSCDKIIISRAYSSESLGLYNFSRESSSMPFNLLISPLMGLMNPSLSDYVNNKQLLSDKLCKYLLAISCIYLPINFGGIYLSDLFVPIVFGKQWENAVGLFNIFMIMTFSSMLSVSLVNIFTLIGEVKILFIVETILSILLLMILLIISDVSLETFSLFRVGYNYFSMLVMLFMIKLFIPLSIMLYMKLLLPPIISSINMVIAINYISELCPLIDDSIKLIILIIIGAFVYFVNLTIFIELLKYKLKEYEFLQATFLKPIYHYLYKIKLIFK